MFFLELALTLIFLIALLVIYDSATDFSSRYPLLRFRNGFLNNKKLSKLIHMFNIESKDLDLYLGRNSILKLLIFSSLVLACSCLFLGPILVKGSLGLCLGLIIALAYIARFVLQLYVSFRDSLLAQIERVLLSIRNNLSSGMTLDYAVNDAALTNTEEPIASDLRNFLIIAETNFLEAFPSWLESLRRKFHLNSLAKSARLLSLELHFTNNQEEAFMDAVTAVDNSILVNKKQRSTLNISLFTLDFMVLVFFLVLFYVIPSFAVNSELNWWHSSERSLVVFQAAAILWGAYLLTVFLAIRRQA